MLLEMLCTSYSSVKKTWTARSCCKVTVRIWEVETLECKLRALVARNNGADRDAAVGMG